MVIHPARGVAHKGLDDVGFVSNHRDSHKFHRREGREAFASDAASGASLPDGGLTGRSQTVIFLTMSASVHAAFDTVESAIADIGAGRLIIVTDDEDRENEGDLIMAASKATPETINMMIRYGSGIVCVPTTEFQLRHLGLGPMVAQNRESQRTDFTVSVDAATGVSTGISAYDRSVAIKILADPNANSDQLVQPGHVFPLRARPGGVLERAGHTEAAVDLAI